jgi:hypothetical protein
VPVSHGYSAITMVTEAWAVGAESDVGAVGAVGAGDESSLFMLIIVHSCLAATVVIRLG